MCISTVIRATVVLQLFSNSKCQFPPMQYPFPQMGQPQPMGPHSMGHMGPHSMAPMAPVQPLPPQHMYPSPMSMGFPMPHHHKMPSVVMPYYSKPNGRNGRRSRRKRRKHRRYEDSTDIEKVSSESHSGEAFDFRRRRTKKRRQVLTPVVSYVTKDGYVVYQKKIKKDKAKDWLEMTKTLKDSKEEQFTSEEEKKFEKMLKIKRRLFKERG